MIYNNMINHLRKWCIQKYEECNSLSTGEVSNIHFKLLQLVGQDFENLSAFCEYIYTLLQQPSNTWPNYTPTRVELYKIEKTKKEFLLHLQQLLDSNEWETPCDLPYERVITGEEADEIISKFNSHWEYSSASYWFPLMGDEPNTVTDKFFIMKKYVEPHWDRIRRSLYQKYSRFYSYGEQFCDLEHCRETATIDELYYEEKCYTDKNFSFFIYFSHEDTVSFAGTIVPLVKDILRNEKEHWNRYEYPEL